MMLVGWTLPASRIVIAQPPMARSRWKAIRSSDTPCLASCVPWAVRTMRFRISIGPMRSGCVTSFRLIATLLPCRYMASIGGPPQLKLRTIVRGVRPLVMPARHDALPFYVLDQGA